MMLRTTWMSAMVAIGLAAMAVGCGDDTTGTDTGLDSVFGDVPVPDATGTAPPDAVDPNVVRRLEFEDDFGDDQVACAGTSRCTISMSFTQDRELKVVYTEDGVPAAGQVVKFEIQDNDSELGRINASSSVTDASGVAKVLTNSLRTEVGQWTVEASIDKSEIPALYFDVVVTPKGQVPLTVVGEYAGSRPVGSYGVLLYRQDAGGEPSCDDPADLMQTQTAAYSRDNILLTQSAQFPDFDNLEEDETQKYTILVFSRNEQDAIQAWGCNDVDGEISWVLPTTVTVEMTDLPPSYVGSYGITSLFDFVSAIPQPYRRWVDFVVSLFQSPVLAITELACDLLTDDCDGVNGFCDVLYEVSENPDGSCKFEPSPVGGFVSDLATAIIDGLTSGTTFGQILTSGGEIADILKAFEMQATLTFHEEPDEHGEWTEEDTHENWHSVRVRWSLGAECTPEVDVNCGDRVFSTNQFQQEAITGGFSARVENDFDLTIDPHSLNLRYGALINYFLESFLLPLVTGVETIDSYDELLGFLITGLDAECLAPGVGDLDCCGTFADDVGGDGDGTVSGGLESSLRAACNGVLNLAPGFIRDQLTGLDADSGDFFQIGTLAPCTLSDFDDDLIIDGVGSQANPCLWDVRLNFGSTTTTIESSFWGARLD